MARELADLGAEDPVVVALPRGGVPVGYEVARALGAPLDIGLVRKLGAPRQPELGIGALGEDGRRRRRRGCRRWDLPRGSSNGWSRASSEELERRRRSTGRPSARSRRGRTRDPRRRRACHRRHRDRGGTGAAARAPRAVILAVPVCPWRRAARDGVRRDRLPELPACVPRRRRRLRGLHPDDRREVVELLAPRARRADARRRSATPADARPAASGGEVDRLATAA